MFAYKYIVAVMVITTVRAWWPFGDSEALDDVVPAAGSATMTPKTVYGYGDNGQGQSYPVDVSPTTSYAPPESSSYDDQNDLAESQSALTQSIYSHVSSDDLNSSVKTASNTVLATASMPSNVISSSYCVEMQSSSALIVPCPVGNATTTAAPSVLPVSTSVSSSSSGPACPLTNVSDIFIPPAYVSFSAPSVLPTMTSVPSLTIAPVSCPYNISQMAPSNISMVFPLDKMQSEYNATQQFCSKRGGGLFCYQPQNDTGCYPNVMILCPDALMMSCRSGFLCNQPDLTFASQCLAINDTLPAEAFTYGAPVPLYSPEGDQVGAEIAQPNCAGYATYLPDICPGPYPIALERCMNKTSNGTITSTSTC